MSTWRERDAHTQLRSRRINERIGLAQAGELVMLRCECRDPQCARVLTIERPVFDAVRAQPGRYVVAINHENPESELVERERDSYAVVDSLPGSAGAPAHR